MDKFEVLRKYKSLLEEGIIDQAEFDAKKKQILAMDDSTDNNEVLINVKDDVPLDNTIEKLVDSKETIQVAEFIPIEDGPSEEELEAIKKNQIYDEALKKLSCNSYKQHSEAIIELEKLGDWRDSEELLEKSKEEVVELEKIEKEKAAEIERVKQAKRKKIKKVLKIAGIAVGIILALFIALIIIANALTPDISEDEKTKKAEINGITYEMPVSWEKLEEESSDSFHRYIKKMRKRLLLWQI